MCAGSFCFVFFFFFFWGGAGVSLALWGSFAHVLLPLSLSCAVLLPRPQPLDLGSVFVSMTRRAPVLVITRVLRLSCAGKGVSPS